MNKKELIVEFKYDYKKNWENAIYKNIRLQEENKKLRDNWNKLKEFINLNYYDSYMYSSTIINKMQELESGRE